MIQPLYVMKMSLEASENALLPMTPLTLARTYMIMKA